MNRDTFLAQLQQTLNIYCKAHRMAVPRLAFYDGETLKIFQREKGGAADVMVPTMMADHSLEESVLRIQSELANRDVLAKVYVISRKSHPEVIEAYEQLCLLNGIRTPPPLLGTHSVFTDAAAIISHDCIVVSDATLALPKDKMLAIVAHELGHLLEPHLPPKDSERAADAAAVRLMGAAKPSVAVEKRHQGIVRHVKRLLENSDNNQLRLVAKLDEHKQRHVEQTRYGREDERLAFIRAQDPTDRSHLEALIEKRNAADEVARRWR